MGLLLMRSSHSSFSFLAFSSAASLAFSAAFSALHSIAWSFLLYCTGSVTNIAAYMTNADKTCEAKAGWYRHHKEVNQYRK
jgi:hypothetical protein